MSKVPEGFHGKKGRSGRKTKWEEHNKVQAINTLWEKVNEKVKKGKELTEYEQKLVLALLPKTIKTETDITSGGDKIIPILGGITKQNEDKGTDKEIQ